MDKASKLPVLCAAQVHGTMDANTMLGELFEEYCLQRLRMSMFYSTNRNHSSLEENSSLAYPLFTLSIGGPRYIAEIVFYAPIPSPPNLDGLETYPIAIFRSCLQIYSSPATNDLTRRLRLQSSMYHISFLSLPLCLPQAGEGDFTVILSVSHRQGSKSITWKAQRIKKICVSLELCDLKEGKPVAGALIGETHLWGLPSCQNDNGDLDFVFNGLTIHNAVSADRYVLRARVLEHERALLVGEVFGYQILGEIESDVLIGCAQDNTRDAILVWLSRVS